MGSLSIKQKLVLVTIVINVAVLIVAGSALLIFDTESIRESMSRELVTFSKVLGNNASAALVFQDTASADEILSALKEREHILSAALYEPDGTVLAQYHRDGGKFSPPKVGADGHHFSDRDFVLFQTIELEGKPAGTIYIQSDLNQLSERRRKIMGGILVLAFLMGAGNLVSLFIVRVILSPMERMTGIAMKIARGDLSQTIRTTSQDEVGVLAKAFSEMTVGLREMIRKFRDAGNEINTRSSEINRGTTQQAAGAAEQSSTVTEVSTTVEELSQTAGRIAENAKDLSGSAEATLNGMKEIKAKVDLVAKKILALGDKSQAVGNITKIIDDLADRTNLLALNAAIEAARAGEAGRGFAVVASEVGKLAERSADSTRDIRQLIGEIQSEINSTVIGVEDTTKWTEKGLKMVGDTTQVIKEISVATYQQKSAAEQVVEAMSNIDQVTTSFASTTRQTAENSEELAKLSSQLKESIAGFKLERDGNGRRD
jgi:methyl-accepting chemotaxis protein